MKRISIAIAFLPMVAGAQLHEKIIYAQQDLVADFEIVATPKPAVKLTLKNPTQGTTLVAEYHPVQVRSFLTESFDGRMAAESLFAKTEVAGMDERIGDLSVELGSSVITTLLRTSEKRRVEFGLSMRAGDQAAMLPLTSRQVRSVLDALRRGARVADSMLTASGRTDPRAEAMTRAADSAADIADNAFTIPAAPAEYPLLPTPVPPDAKGFLLSARFIVDSTGRIERLEFDPTPNAAYNRKLDTTLRRIRFLPGMSLGGKRVRTRYVLHRVL